MRCVIDSAVVGVAKPDPAIFDHAEVHFPGIARDRIAYVGDSVTMDVGGATAAGLHPILIDPYDDHPGADLRPHQGARPTSWIDHRVLRPGGHRSTVEREPRMGGRHVRRRAITFRQRVSSAPSKIDRTRASTNRRLTRYSSA